MASNYSLPACAHQSRAAAAAGPAPDAPPSRAASAREEGVARRASVEAGPAAGAAERRRLTRMTRRPPGRSAATALPGPPPALPVRPPERPCQIVAASRTARSFPAARARWIARRHTPPVPNTHTHVPPAPLALRDRHTPLCQPPPHARGTWHTRRHAAPAPGAPGTVRRASLGRWRSSLASRAR